MLPYTYILLDEVSASSFRLVTFRHEFHFNSGFDDKFRERTELMQPIYDLATEQFGPGHRGLMSGEKPVDNRWIYWGRTIVLRNPEDAMLFRLMI